MAKITLYIPTPKKWWHVLLFPLTVPMVIVFCVVTIPLIWLYAWVNGDE